MHLSMRVPGQLVFTMTRIYLQKSGSAVLLLSSSRWQNWQLLHSAALLLLYHACGSSTCEDGMALKHSSDALKALTCHAGMLCH